MGVIKLGAIFVTVLLVGFVIYILPSESEQIPSGSGRPVPYPDCTLGPEVIFVTVLSLELAVNKLPRVSEQIPSGENPVAAKVTCPFGTYFVILLFPAFVTYTLPEESTASPRGSLRPVI